VRRNERGGADAARRADTELQLSLPPYCRIAHKRTEPLSEMQRIGFKRGKHYAEKEFMLIFHF